MLFYFLRVLDRVFGLVTSNNIIQQLSVTRPKLIYVKIKLKHSCDHSKHKAQNEIILKDYSQFIPK
jgi:hypothetical protein